MTASQDAHPDPLQLDALVDGTLKYREEAALSTHVETCQRCRAYVEDIRRLDNRLRQLPVHARRAPPLSAEIMHRLAAGSPRDSRRVWRSASMVGAAAALFLFGIVVGRLESPAPAARSRSEQAFRKTPPPVLEVQRLGTAYVSALATLAVQSASPSEAAVDREVVASTLHGAAVEAARILQDDALGRRLIETTEAARSMATAQSARP